MLARAMPNMLGALAVAGLCGGAMTGAASQEPVPEMAGLAGRFVGMRSGEIIDLAPCGMDWCGIRVAPSGACGDRAMRLAVRAGRNGVLSLEGRFDRQPGGYPHAVAGTLQRRPGEDGPSLRLHGEPGDTLRYLRRTFPYSETFLSRGEARCRVENATS